MEILTKELGNALRVKDVAEYLGVDRKTIINHYRELGGMRVTSQ